MAQVDTVTRPVAGPDQGPMATGNPLAPAVQAPVSGRAAQLRGAFQAAAQVRGLPYLGWNDPTSLLLWQVYYNLTPQQAQQAAYAVAKHNADSGQPFSDADLDAIGFGARSGQTGQQIQYGPNAQTEQSAPIQALPASGAGQAIQDAVGKAGQTQTFTDSSGNIDPSQQPALLGYITQGAQAAGVTLSPQQALQLAQEGVQYHQATGQALPASYVDQEIGTMTGRVVPHPSQVNPAVWDSLGPVGQGLALSAASAAGWDTDEYQRQINAQRPVGTARPSSGIDYGSGLGTGVV